MFYFEAKDAPYKHNYSEMTRYLNKQIEAGEDKNLKNVIYSYATIDLFFLSYFVLGIPCNHPWLVSRINEIEECHNRTLDLWAREHFKSSLITYALTIQKILQNPERRCAIFSNTKSLAKKFLRRIKHTFEQNKFLQIAFSDILYENPDRQSPKWSEDEGLLVKRKGTYQEMTLEAHGVTEAMPTGMHYPIRVYDDLVTWDTTRTAEQILKTKDGFQMSHNLEVTDGSGEVRVIGTRYDFHDLYNDMIKSGEWIIRERPGDIEPAYWSEEVIEQKRKDMGKYIFATQISLKPLTEDEQKFELEWLKYYTEIPKNLNKYIVVDPAGDGKKEKSSYSVFFVIGVDWNQNYYILDLVRDKLNLQGRWAALRDLYLKHAPISNVGYEKYSMQADIQYIQEKQYDEHCVFALTPLGGKTKKDDRIRNMVHIFEQGRFHLPKELWYKDVEGKNRDLIYEFINEEYTHFPNITYKDMLDCLARITEPDLGIIYPAKIYPAKNVIKMIKEAEYTSLRPAVGWMGR